MNGLPSLLTRPPVLLAAPADASLPPGVALAPVTAVRLPLDSGLPARIPLTGDRVLVLAVSLGRARELLAADPAAVVVTLADSGSLAPVRDPDQPVARVTLLDGSTIGDSSTLTRDVRLTLGVHGAASVELVVSALTVTVGSMRSPGQYGSSIAFRWRDVRPGADAGPWLATGDDSIPRRRLEDTQYSRKEVR